MYSSSGLSTCSYLKGRGCLNSTFQPPLLTCPFQGRFSLWGETKTHSPVRGLYRLWGWSVGWNWTEEDSAIFFSAYSPQISVRDGQRVPRNMSSFSEQVFQEKLTRLSSSQDSIETLSLWIIHHKAHGSSVVDIWMQNFIQGKWLIYAIYYIHCARSRDAILLYAADQERRLLLLYLVNDVLQNGRRKGVDVYHDLYQDPLRHAASLVRFETVTCFFELILSVIIGSQKFDPLLRELFIFGRKDMFMITFS